MATAAYRPARNLTDAVIPVRGLWVDAILVVTAAALIAVAAQIRIALPFTPVPITASTFAVLLLGASLGARRGAAATVLYLVAGWGGMPVFSNGGSGAVWTIATGGYIVGYIPAAYLVGMLAERGWDRGPWLLAAMLAGNALIYVPGLIHLGNFLTIGFERTLELGLWPFVVGDLVKIILASLAVPAGWSAVQWAHGRGLWPRGRAGGANG